LGITASRRVGNAVVRNRVKRLVREWFRTGRPASTRGFDIVVIARKGVEQWPAARIRAELDRLVAMGVAGYGDAKC
jgi:ribonuclease P protein component